MMENKGLTNTYDYDIDNFTPSITRDFSRIMPFLINFKDILNFPFKID